MTAFPGLSVMIPTWRPDIGYLETGVSSVLRQLGPDQTVQVELVDDASPDFDVAAFANRIGGGRVSTHRNAQRLGLAGNWNACIARAKHQWIHLLHQDDFLLDGFYAAIIDGIDRAPHIGAAFTANSFADAAGKCWAPRLVPMREAGVLDDWVEHVFVRLSIQCSAIVVRRDVYESVGGFDADLRYTLDWDMWKRIAVRRPIWFEPEPLACFRRHAGSETARQRDSGEHVAEIFRSIARSTELLPPGVAARTVRRSQRHYAAFTVEEAGKVLRGPGGGKRALGMLNTARQHVSPATMAGALGKVLARGCVRRTRTWLGRG